MQLVQTGAEKTSGLLKCRNAAFHKQRSNNFVNSDGFRKIVNYLYIIIFP